MTSTPALVIFDCDGVLVDSEPISNRVLAESITEAGMPIDAEAAARSSEGMRLEDIQAEVEAGSANEKDPRDDQRPAPQPHAFAFAVTRLPIRHRLQHEA